MKTRSILVLFAIILVALTSCSHSVSGNLAKHYEVVEPSNVGQITMNKNANIDSANALGLLTFLGTFKLGESGFSTKCSEAHAMAILEEKARELGANYVNITKEARPDVWSSCYRCTADFYFINETGLQVAKQIPDNLKVAEVNTRVSEDHNRMTGMVIGTIIGSILAFIILSSF